MKRFHLAVSMLLFMLLAGTMNALAQKESFDLVSFSPPRDWEKEVKENIILYSTLNKEKKTWCQIGVVKSTTSKGSIELDFESEWQELIVKNYHPASPPGFRDAEESGKWKIMSGESSFIFNNAEAVAILVTMSGFNRCVSIVSTTNHADYLKDIAALIASVELQEPETAPAQASPQDQVQGATEPTPKGFHFVTTRFDDGWVAVVEPDWVQITKENMKVLIHYPNKETDAYNPVLLDGLKNAWQVLVAGRYSGGSNPEFRPVSGWEPIEFAEADMVEKSTGARVHVVLFKKHYSNGSGKYIEFISQDKASFEKDFGVYEERSYGWERMEKMAGYNRFAIDPRDLEGKWTSNFSSSIQYVNAHTGLDAGMNTHASAENFEFLPGNQYRWDLGVASGEVGRIKFQSVKSSGTFSMKDNWSIQFSDIEGKPRSYNAYFSCIRGLRILWVGDRAFGRLEGK